MLNLYITDLKAYNENSLVGRWVSLPKIEQELVLDVKGILECGETSTGSSNHEEWFITDYEWDEISLFDVDEYADIYKLNHQLQLLEELQTYELKSIAYLIDAGIAISIEDALEKLDDVVIHEEQTMIDVAYNFIHEYYDIDKQPYLLRTHIDYEGIARDMELEGNYTTMGSDTFEYIG